MISLDPAQRAHHDFEGGSPLDIKAVGAYRWITHPGMQIWMMSWRIGATGPISRWHPGDPDPVALLDHVHRGGTMVAHNAGFERDMWNLGVRRKYCTHWPELHLEQQDCTLARASTLALPAGLDFVTQVLHTDAHKDHDGSKLMIKMARPRKVLICETCRGSRIEEVYGGHGTVLELPCSMCGGLGETYEWWNSPENIAREGIYCDADIEAETSVDMKVLHHTDRERRVWEMDQRINSRGVKLDRPLIEQLIEVVAVAKRHMDAEMHRLTHGYASTCGQVAKIVEWINACGVECASIAKGEQADLLIAADATDIPEIRQVVELRAIASKSSTAKLRAMLNCMAEDDRARGLLFYHGTIGGRWAGRLIQPHNLYVVDHEEDGNDILHTIELALGGQRPDLIYDAVDTIVGPPMVAIAKCMRSMFIAEKGKRFIGGDKANIEGRINAWLSGEQWLLDAFRAYDAGVGADLYRVTYAQSFGVPVEQVRGSLRQVGKVTFLSCYYQGSVGALLKMAKNKGIPLKPLLDTVRGAASMEDWDAMASRYKTAPRKHGLKIDMWTALSLVVKKARDASPNIVQGWWDLQDAAIEAVEAKGQVIEVFNGRIRYLFARGFLWCSLPSTRLIAYCNPSVLVVDESYWLIPTGRQVVNGDRFEMEMLKIPHDEVAPWEEEETKLKGGRLVKREKKQVWYEGYDGETRRWSTFPLYGGMQCAHVVSAIARDCLVEDMFELERRGYHMVLTVHDEVLNEEEFGFGSAEEVNEILCRQPWFIDDQALPMAAKCWEDVRYAK